MEASVRAVEIRSRAGRSRAMELDYYRQGSSAVAIAKNKAVVGVALKTLGGLLLAMFVIVVIVQPTGDFPLNDDFQYAHVAKTLAETGRFRVDTPVAPSLAGQSFLAAPLIRALGFSHTSLRVLTIVMSIVLMVCLHGLLRLSGAGTISSFLAMLLVAVNPLFVNLEMSFMTEIYGFTVALAGVWLWMKGGRSGSLALQICGAVLMGSAFWIRQLCVLAFPALVLSEWIVLRQRREAAGRAG